jgi:hypothetical protein
LAEGVLIANGQTVPQNSKTPQCPNLAVPGLDRLRREVTGAADLPACRQESVQAGEPDHLIARTLGEDPVKAGLLGARVP